MDAKAAKRWRFEQAWESIRRELVEHVAGEGMPKDAVEWYRNVSALGYLFFLMDFILLLRTSTTM
jgi:hypothetical protein